VTILKSSGSKDKAERANRETWGEREKERNAVRRGRGVKVLEGSKWVMTGKVKGQNERSERAGNETGSIGKELTETDFIHGVHGRNLYLKTLAVTARGKAQAAEGQSTPPVDTAEEASSNIVKRCSE
jgi:uncharacterized membrane-anchored protein